MKKNNKKTLESFSFGYGNNDYLSDLGNPDIKDKMGATAFQSDPVGVQPGLVNEINSDLLKELKKYKNDIFEALKQLEGMSFGGGSLYSSDNSISGDSPHSRTEKNDIDFDEDLEYSRVSDATKDEFILTENDILRLKEFKMFIDETIKMFNLKEERKKSYMDGSVAVDVKKKCRLGGLGSTSVACNQGDIKNLEFRKIK